jgi:hypothetical protein
MDPKQVVRTPEGLRCRECGFAYTLSPVGVADQTIAGLAMVEAAGSAVPQERRGVRPKPDVWSVNAYLAHLPDAARIISERVQAIVEHDNPWLPWVDESQAAEQGRYDERPAEESLAELRPLAEAFAAYIRKLPADAWERVGTHSTAGEVQMRDIAHDMPHELKHHAEDIRRIGSESPAAQRQT